jgi:DNA-binding IclR family transcriptional regulator
MPMGFAVLDCLLWRVRRPGRKDLCVTYAAVARLCGIARSTAIDMIRKLVGIGLIEKIKRRVLVR